MPTHEPELQGTQATTLLVNCAAFQGFGQRRLGDDQLEADAVQESLLRGLGCLILAKFRQYEGSASIKETRRLRRNFLPERKCTRRDSNTKPSDP